MPRPTRSSGSTRSLRKREIAFDPTATYVAIISIEGVGEARFAVSRVSDGSTVGSGPLNIDFVGKVAISPDGRTLAVSRSSGDVRFVDVKSAHMTEPPVLHPVYIQSIAFRPTDVGLITYQINGRGYVWDLALGYPGAVVIAPKTPVVHSESGYWIALMTNKGIRALGPDGQDSTRRIPADTSVEALAVSNDGKRLVWMQSAGSLDSDLRTNDGVICTQEYAQIKFAMSPDGRWVITDCGSSLHQFKLFDLAAHRFTSASVSNSRQRPVFDESGALILTSESAGACIHSLPMLAAQGCIPIPEGEAIVAMAYLGTTVGIWSG